MRVSVPLTNSIADIIKSKVLYFVVDATYQSFNQTLALASHINGQHNQQVNQSN